MMVKQRFLRAMGTGVLCGALVLATACGVSQPMAEVSVPSSVEIPQSQIESQLKVGMCWSYATIALVESDFKMRTGRELNLSEEALGFYRILEELYYIAKTNTDLEDTLTALQTKSFEGWILKKTAAMNAAMRGADEGASRALPLPDAFELLSKYGVVPEDQWSFKFETREETKRVIDAIKVAFAQFLKATPPAQILEWGKEKVLEILITHVMTAPGAFPARPPESIVDGGRRVKPNSFLKQGLGFQPLSFGYVDAQKPEDLPPFIAAIKRALVRGVSVPLGYPVNFDRLHGDRFSGAGVDTSRPENFFREGGHAVLIKDFVNVGGVEGGIPLPQLAREFARSPLDLDYFVVKNSWGLKARTNEAGIPIGGSETGYYKIDRSYLLGATGVSQVLPGLLVAIVPKDIAVQPLAAEPINPRVVINPFTGLWSGSRD